MVVKMVQMKVLSSADRSACWRETMKELMLDWMLAARLGYLWDAPRGNLTAYLLDM